ncbi:uncharacterized protein PpBr36_09895 [Pyricularia pennisetigena]|uniref:uncharacterized protein n=1 Tax=Pyricularia pennisetigena TaxID=1578925 RepID=UPI00114D9E48|nr:uncharacterized protein PpBr36_09895 [Pyricularia pennisetigena]TLS22544.1 hypothetical protein PpBr36_09895 [Pyricularia pennisetigena]
MKWIWILEKKILATIAKVLLATGIWLDKRLLMFREEVLVPLDTMYQELTWLQEENQRLEAQNRQLQAEIKERDQLDSQQEEDDDIHLEVDHLFEDVRILVQIARKRTGSQRRTPHISPDDAFEVCQRILPSLKRHNEPDAQF